VQDGYEEPRKVARDVSRWHFGPSDRHYWPFVKKMSGLRLLVLPVNDLVDGEFFCRTGSSPLPHSAVQYSTASAGQYFTVQYSL
jgi:hypothetical protein